MTGFESSQPTADPLDVILATGGYDNTIRFWEAWSGICVKSINHPQSVSTQCINLPSTHINLRTTWLISFTL